MSLRSNLQHNSQFTALCSILHFVLPTYFLGYKSIREISRHKFLGLKTRILSYTRVISRPPLSSILTVFAVRLFLDLQYLLYLPYDDVLMGLTDAETLELFKSDDEEDEFDRF